MPRRAEEEQEREDRILFEVVVDAYNETERTMSWYYYLQDALKVPFAAICRKSEPASMLRVGQEVQVLGLAREDNCMSEVYVIAKVGQTKIAVPLDQLECQSTDEQTCQAVADWHYWRARGYAY